MRVKSCSRVLALSLILFFFVGCAGMSTGSKPISQMTPMERLTYVEGMYNSQYEDYQRMAGYSMVDGKWVQTSKPDIAPAKKGVMHEKKEALTEIYPMIQTYRTYVMAGTMPPAQQEAALFELLDKLTNMALE